MAGETDWNQIASWLMTLPGSVLLCFENAEEPLSTSLAQVSLKNSLVAQCPVRHRANQGARHMR